MTLYSLIERDLIGDRRLVSEVVPNFPESPIDGLMKDCVLVQVLGTSSSVRLGVNMNKIVSYATEFCNIIVVLY